LGAFFVSTIKKTPAKESTGAASSKEECKLGGSLQNHLIKYTQQCNSYFTC
jgi:hypothetical protein